MFNLKEQNAPVDHNLSADDILANIKKRLGLVDEHSSQPQQQRRETEKNQNAYAQQTVAQAPKSKYDQEPQANQPLRNAQPQDSYKQQSPTEYGQRQSMQGQRQEQKNQIAQSELKSSHMNDLDDDFSFDLDFAESSSNTKETNANKAYRAYQNAMKSSNAYGEESFANKNQHSQHSQNFEEMESDELEQEWDALESDEDNNEGDDAFGWNMPEETNHQKNENVYFLKGNHSANTHSTYNQEPRNARQEGYEGEEMSSFGEVAQNIERAFVQIARQQIHNWCENNLENICRKIIREELYKEKVDSNKNQ